MATRSNSDKIDGVALESASIQRSQAPDINAAAAILVTSDGRALWSRNATKPRAMASITKMMVALVILERGDLNDTITISKSAANVPYALGLKAGERVPARRLLELALVASSNDAAYALAEHYGGTMPRFIGMMNQRASQLGLRDTRFVNPHGLDARGHHSSAADLASLTQRAMREPEFRRIVAMRTVTMPGYKKRKAHKYDNTNELLGRYQGLLGGKTGFTDNAGFSLATSAQRNGITLTTVVMGTHANSSRFKTADRLLDWGFKHLRTQTVAKADETVAEVPLAVNHEQTVIARFAETTSAIVFDLEGPVVRSLSLPENIELPVFQGQKLGHAQLKQGKRVVADVPLVAAADLASVTETVGAVPVTDYVERRVTARTVDTSIAVPAFDATKPVQRTVSLDKQVNAPVAKGTRLGQIVYAQNGKPIVTVPVVAAEKVDKPSAISTVGIWLTRAWRGIVGEPTIASLEVAE